MPIERFQLKEMSRLSTPTDAVASQKSIAVAYKATVSFTILVSILLVIGLRHLGSDPLFACGLFGAFLVFLGSRPNLKHIGLAIGAGLILEFVYTLLGGPFGPFSSETLSYIKREHGFVTVLEEVEEIGAFLGVGSILVMSLYRLWTGSSRYVSFLGDALLLPGFSLFVGLVLRSWSLKDLTSASTFCSTGSIHHLGLRRDVRRCRCFEKYRGSARHRI